MSHPAEYQALEPRGVRHLASGAVVLPDSPLWRDYEVYLGEGGDVLPADPPPAPTAEENAARVELAERETLRGQLSVDAGLRALRTRTPEQVDAWIDANVTNLAQAREVLKLLARVVALIARERL